MNFNENVNIDGAGLDKCDGKKRLVSYSFYKWRQASNGEFTLDLERKEGQSRGAYGLSHVWRMKR